MQTTAGHPLDARDPEARRPYSAARDPDAYRERIAQLMSLPGVSAWQALMKQNAERAKRRRDVA